ncbi:hypothetical protein JGF38_22890 [Salmonella enterica subsp. enterica serovar Hadar]|nr:hypothetical protein [Salmonella enterica subsp. enterica serovar Hadar]
MKLQKNEVAGRKKKISERSRRTLTRVVKQNRKSSLVEITQEFQSSSGVSASSRTVRRELKNLGFHGRVAAQKPNITPQNAKRRLKWCKVMNLALQSGSPMDASGFGGCPASAS